MNLHEYIQLAKRTECDYKLSTIKCPSLEPHNAARLVHMALGLTTEALEFKASLDKNLPQHEQLMEMSDICWFSALACEELGTLPTVAQSTYPQLGVQKVLDLCELFGSRVKAALVYGSPVKESDPYPEYWKRVPAEILQRTYAIASMHLSGEDILDLNITKLKARYGDKFTKAAALVRNENAEAKAVLSVERLEERILAKRQPAMPKLSTLLLNAQNAPSPTEAKPV